MVSDLSQQITPLAAGSTPRQAITGVMPPQLCEAHIREVFATVLARAGGLASLARAFYRTGLLVPLGWLLLAPFFALKFAPGFCTRYTLTNRALQIRRGLRPRVRTEVLLDKIDDVRFDPASYDDFFLSGTLEIVSQGQVILRLLGVPEPEGFRQSIINSVSAWAGKKLMPFVPAS